MPYREPALLAAVALRFLLPPLLGGIGAALATTLPAYYDALCRSPMIPLYTPVVP